MQKFMLKLSYALKFFADETWVIVTHQCKQQRKFAIPNASDIPSMYDVFHCYLMVLSNMTIF